MSAWFRTQRGLLFLVADVSRSVLTFLLPIAWGLALPGMDRGALPLWLCVGAFYVVHEVALSSAVRRDRAEQKPPTIVNSTTIDGVPLTPEEAVRLREIVDGARKRQNPEEDTEEKPSIQ